MKREREREREREKRRPLVDSITRTTTTTTMPLHLRRASASQSEVLRHLDLAAPESPESPDSFGGASGSHNTKSSKKVFGKLWNTVKQNAKLLKTPQSGHFHRQRRMSLGFTPRQLGKDFEAGGGYGVGAGASGNLSGAGEGAGGEHDFSLSLKSTRKSFHFDDKSWRLEGLDAKSLARKRVEIEKLRNDASSQLQKELLKHQKQLILTSEMISDLHRTLGSLRKCIVSMKSILPVYQNLTESAGGVDLEAKLERHASSNRGEGGNRSTLLEQAGPSPEAAGASGVGGGDSKPIVNALAEQDIGRIIKHLEELRRTANANATSTSNSATSFEEIQLKILSITSAILEDDNSSRSEIKLSVRCITLISSPTQARRLLLRRYTNLLQQPLSNFRQRKAITLVPHIAAFSSTFLSIIGRAANDCREYFGKSDNGWSSDFLCWCIEELQTFCGEIQKCTLSFISSGGEIRQVAELICIILAESTIIGRQAHVSPVLVMEDDLIAMLMTAIGAYLPRVGQNAALQGTSEIAQFAQLLDDEGEEEEQKKVYSSGSKWEGSFNNLSGSTSTVSKTLDSLLEQVAPVLNPALRGYIQGRMVDLFKQYMSLMGDSVKRYAQFVFVKKDLTESKRKVAEETREKMLGNIRAAAERIIDVKGDASLKVQVDSEIEGFRRTYDEAFLGGTSSSSS